MWKELSYNKFKNREEENINEPFTISEYYTYMGMECEECLDIEDILNSMLV